MVASQILGLALCRHVLKIPPAAEMSPKAIVELVGPTIQRYAADPLPWSSRWHCRQKALAPRLAALTA